MLIINHHLLKNEPLDETPIYSGDTQKEDGYYYVTTTTSDSYYKDAIDLIGDALKLRLRTIINTKHRKTNL